MDSLGYRVDGLGCRVDGLESKSTRVSILAVARIAGETCSEK